MTTAAAAARASTARPASALLRPYRVTVAANTRITPRLARITLAAADLAHLATAAEVGPERRGKILLPPAPGATVTIPDGNGFWDAMRALPDDVRPVVRTYTVRSHRADQGEIDIDFVLHDGHSRPGPAAAWAAAARPGDEIGFYGCRGDVAPPAGTTSYLLVGDETALPAIAAITEHLPAGVAATLLIETADAAEEQPIPGHADLAVTWLRRDGREPGTTTLLADAVRALGPLPHAVYAWVAGETAMTQDVRRHLALDRDLTKDRLHVSGYWRRGVAGD